jgi:hypothetical protein
MAWAGSGQAYPDGHAAGLPARAFSLVSILAGAEAVAAYTHALSLIIRGNGQLIKGLEPCGVMMRILHHSTLRASNILHSKTVRIMAIPWGGERRDQAA